MTVYNCFFDGSCTPVNPSGYMGAGSVIECNGLAFEVAQGFRKFDNNTNNLAEYHAFYKLLDLLRNKQGCKINIYGDSMLVVNQMNGKVKMKNGSYIAKAQECLLLLMKISEVNEVKIEWVNRDKNQRADYLSRFGASLTVASGNNEVKSFTRKIDV